MDKCTYNICIKQGANFYWQVYIVDEVDGVEVPTDLTGHSAEMQIRKTYDDTEILVTYSTDNGIITLDEANGIITINDPAAATKLYASDFKGVYDLETTSPAGFVDRVIEGQAIVTPEVTR